jgi:hypothetical protein
MTRRPRPVRGPTTHPIDAAGVDTDAGLRSLYATACIYVGSEQAESLVAGTLGQRTDPAVDLLGAHAALFEAAGGPAWRSPWPRRLLAGVARRARPRPPGEAAVAARFGALPPLEQAVLHLCDGEGLSYDQVATVTGMDRDAVGRLVSRGRRRLRRSRWTA